MDQNFPAFVEDVEKELKKLVEGWEIPNTSLLPLEYTLQGIPSTQDTQA